MKKNTKNILIASGVAAAVAVCASTLHHVIAKSLMTVAMDRKAPKAVNKTKDKIMGSPELVNIIAQLTDTAKALEQSDHERVTLTSFDETLLVGHWFVPENPKRVIVAMHGWRSTWAQDFGVIANFWLQNGCCVLFAEQRGQGESGGEYMGFGLLERFDCMEWIKWVNERTEGKLPIYPAGLSMGASTVLMTAADEHPESVRGIMADAAFTSPHAIWKHVVQNNLHIPYALYSGVASNMCHKKIQMRSTDYSCPEALKGSKVPILFIHGTDDKFVPVTHTYENYKACTSQKRLLVVPGADHCLSYLVDRESYEKATLDFWKENDTFDPDSDHAEK